MDLKGYKKKMKEDEEWAPGWDAIEACFESLYPGQKPKHYGTLIPSRAIFGGNEYLDGISVYRSPKGHLHLVTFGMSNLYADEDAFGGEWSNWGYEMTIRLPLCEETDFMWAIDMLSNLARYTFTTKRFFEPMQFISAKGNPIKSGSDSLLTGLLIIEDPELPCVDTVHGRLGFMQVVGITRAELDAVSSNEERLKKLVEIMGKDDPFFVTDLKRTKCYI